MSQAIVAVNHAGQSSNPVHTDSGAQNLGLRSGMVGGTTLLGYLSRPAYERWGEDWRSYGAIQARFRAPIHDGDELRLEVSAHEEGLVAALINAEGTRCATAEVSPPQSGHDSELPIPGRVPTETGGELPLISYETLQDCEGLRPFPCVAYPGRLEALDDANPSWSANVTGLADVDNLAVASIGIMYATFRAAGPRILTALSTRQYQSVRNGQALEARGHIAEVRRHRGRTYARNDILIRTAAGAPVARIQNETIWELP